MRKRMTVLAICVAVIVVYSQEHQMCADEMKVCTWRQLNCTRTQHDLGTMYTNGDGVKTIQQEERVCESKKCRISRIRTALLVGLALAYSLWDSSRKREGVCAFGFRTLPVLAWILLPVLVYCLLELTGFIGYIYRLYSRPL